MAAFRMEFPTRPCLVKGKKHIFHQWENRAWVAEPGIMVGSAPGGQCSMTLAIVEDEYGQVHEVYPEDVRFIDDKVKEAFVEGGECDGQISCFPDENGQGT